MKWRRPFLAALRSPTPRFRPPNLRYVILIAAVTAAIATPTPDARTTLTFMTPGLALYALGIGVAAVVNRGRQ
jgi:Sec-independent protein secretion pathway component TatC